MPSYADSLNNMDASIVTNDIPRRPQKSRQVGADVTQQTDNNSLDLTPEDVISQAEQFFDEEDEHPGTHSHNQRTGPSRSSLATAVTSISAERGPSWSTTPGPSRIPLSTTATSIATILKRSSTKTASKNSDLGWEAAGWKDFGRLYLLGLEEEKTVNQEKLCLKREQFEVLKKDTMDKNAIELKRIELDQKRLEQEHMRSLKQQKLDHDFRLAQLRLNADRGREPVP